MMSGQFFPLSFAGKVHSKGTATNAYVYAVPDGCKEWTPGRPSGYAQIILCKARSR